MDTTHAKPVEEVREISATLTALWPRRPYLPRWSLTFLRPLREASICCLRS